MRATPCCEALVYTGSEYGYTRCGGYPATSVALGRSVPQVLCSRHRLEQKAGAEQRATTQVCPCCKGKGVIPRAENERGEEVMTDVDRGQCPASPIEKTTSEEREAFLKLEEAARGMTPGNDSYMKCISDALQRLDTARHVNHGSDDRNDMPICRKVGIEKNVGQWTVTSDNGHIRVLCEDEATARRIGDMLTQKRGSTA